MTRFESDPWHTSSVALYDTVAGCVKVPAGLALRPGGNRRETKCIELVLPAPLTGQPSQTVARGERA